jgi:peroxiredoxin
LFSWFVPRRRNVTTTGIVILSALLLVGSAAIAQDDDTGSASNEADFPPRFLEVTESQPQCGEAVVGELAPWLAGWTLDEEEFNVRKPFEDPRFQRLALVFFADWCIQCRVGISQLAAQANRIDSNGVYVALVSVRDAPKRARRFLRGLEIPFPIVLDPAGESEKTYLGAKNGKYFLPRTAIISREGHVEAIFGREGDDFVDRVIAGK